MNLEKLLTEGRNERTLQIDRASTLDIVTMINQEDHNVAPAVAKVLPAIAQAVDGVVESFKQGGRLFYIGAGTSGRLGILDASECPPTYGTDPELVQGLIAGGTQAVFHAVEGAEDSPEMAQEDLQTRKLTNKDMVVGIAASGRTPYVIGGLQYAKSIGCRTAAVSCTPNSEIGAVADIDIAALVGPEVIMGSTRMKAGTAQKLILNMITTAAMIRTGKVYGNLMVNLEATNKKLIERGKRIVRLATDCSQEQAEQALAACKGNVKLAIIMLLTGVTAAEAMQRLQQNDGVVARSLEVDNV